MGFTSQEFRFSSDSTIFTKSSKFDQWGFQVVKSCLNLKSYLTKILQKRRRDAFLQTDLMLPTPIEYMTSEAKNYPRQV